MEESKLKQLKVTELKDLLNKLSLSTSGKKDDLIARLVQHYTTSSQTVTLNEHPASTEATTPTTTASVIAVSKPPHVSQDEQPLKIEEKIEELEPTSVDEELEKRKKRALKFGTSTDSEEIKKLERAKRFGTTSEGASNPVGKLNKALSSNSHDTAVISEDPQKRLQRIERFGTATEKEELARKRVREERFGTLESAEPTEKKQKV